MDTALDFRQLLRHLTDSAPRAPQWCQHRPAMLVQAAEFHQQHPARAVGDAAAVGTLLLRGYVRGLGLSANQAVHIAGAGDFQLAQIDGMPESQEAHEPPSVIGQQQAGAVAMDQSAGEGPVPVLAVPDPEQQESLVRENVPDPLAGEQTWPTEEVRISYSWNWQTMVYMLEPWMFKHGLFVLWSQELMEAAVSKTRKRRLPRGISDYQAAWILDDRLVQAPASPTSAAGVVPPTQQLSTYGVLLLNLVAIWMIRIWRVRGRRNSSLAAVAVMTNCCLI